MIFGRIPLLKRSMFSQIHQISIHFVLLFKKTVETYGTIRRHHRQNPTCRLINRASPRADWWFTILYITKLEITSWKTMFFGQEWYYPHTMFILEQKLMIESDWMCVYACAFFCGYSVRIHHPSSIIHGQNCHHWMMILPRCGVFAGSGKKISCTKNNQSPHLKTLRCPS